MEQRRVIRWLGGTAVVALAAMGITQVAAAMRAPSVSGVTTPPPVVDSPGSDPAVSGDGRYVVYAAPPAAEDGRVSSIWLRDQATGASTELTVPTAGVRAGESVSPAISADGCTVTIVTEMAFDLFHDDDDEPRWDVYNLRLQHCADDPSQWSPTWQVVSERNGDAANNAVPGQRPAVSGTGDVVAYVHSFSAAEPELTTVSVTDLTVLPGEPGRNLRVRGTPAEAPATTFRYAGLSEPSISDDGSVVAYSSDAVSDAETPTWGSGPEPGGLATSRAYVWDRLAASAPVVALAEGSSDPMLSGDGQSVVFVSAAPDLVPNTRSVTCDTSCATQVYLFDRATATLSMLSSLPATTTAPAQAGDGAATDPVISADGSTVVYVSQAGNLFPTKTAGAGGPGLGEIISVNTLTKSLRRISVMADGVNPAAAVNASPAISGNARVVVFDTMAPSDYAAASSTPAAPGRYVVSVTEPTVVTISDLDLGTVAVSALSPEWYVKLINLGNTTFTPAVISSADPQFAITSASTCFPGVPVLPGGSCRVALTMTPDGEGPRSSVLTIAEEGYLGTTVTASLRGAGGIPTLDPVTGGGRWPATAVGQNGGPKTFSIENVGLVPVQASKVEVLGANPDDFTLVGGNCTAKAFGAGTACLVEVVFTPTAAGLRTASVRVSTAEGMYTTVLLDGQAFYASAVVASSPTVQAGGSLQLTGSGFAPNTAVSLMWADGAGATYSAITDGYGTFTAVVTIGRAERTGSRQLVAQSASGEVAGVAVEITPLPRRINAGSPVFPRP
jgi:Tol biopolymer transport system component